MGQKENGKLSVAVRGSRTTVRKFPNISFLFSLIFSLYSLCGDEHDKTTHVVKTLIYELNVTSSEVTVKENHK